MRTINLELKLDDTGEIGFLNYWDHVQAEDVCVDYRGGKLFLGSTEISLKVFVKSVFEIVTNGEAANHE